MVNPLKRTTPGSNLTRKGSIGGQSPFRVKNDQEIGQLSADLTNNGVRLSQLWVIFRIRLTPGSNLTRKGSIGGQSPFRVKDDQEIGQLSADLTNNGVRLSQLWVIFRIRLTPGSNLTRKGSIGGQSPFRVKDDQEIGQLSADLTINNGVRLSQLWVIFRIRLTPGSNLTRKGSIGGQSPFRVKDDQEIGQLSAHLTNNGVRLSQLWVIFRIRLTDFRVIVDPEWSLAPMDPNFQVKFDPVFLGCSFVCLDWIIQTCPNFSVRFVK